MVRLTAVIDAVKYLCKVSCNVFSKLIIELHSQLFQTTTVKNLLVFQYERKLSDQYIS